MNILTFSDYYFPGHKAGGPLRTLYNLVDRIGDGFDFTIVTRDRDLGDKHAYPDVTSGARQMVGKAEVFYLPPRRLSFGGLRRLVNSVEHDVLYLNSFFSPTFTVRLLLLRRLSLIPRRPLVLAPRGEFSAGALALKKTKKRIYIALSKALRMYEGVVWQASSVYEKGDIHRVFGDNVSVVVAPDLPAAVHDAEAPLRRHKKVAGSLKVAFLSRVSPMKNLDSALLFLDGLEGEIQFNIFGPLEDKGYWARCQKVIRRLPQNVQVQYRGVVAHERVVDILAEHDLLLLPTQGENFGHVILEALVAGCPVLVSDRTPWRSLQSRGVGWDFPLEEPERFRSTLRYCVGMRDEEHQTWSQRARTFGLALVQDHAAVQLYEGLFKDAVSGRASGV